MKLNKGFILYILLILCANTALRAQGKQVTIVKTVTTTGQPTVKTYTNLSGQTVRESNQRFDGTYMSTDYVYDTYGRLKKVSVPHRGSTIPEWEEYRYDSYDRTTKSRDASGKIEISEYKPLTVTKTTDNISRTTTVDVMGQTVSIEDAAGAITYAYRADGQLDFVVAPGEDVDSKPIITSFEYDGYGRKNKIVDPSAGVKTFVWSGADSIYTETDARNKVIKTIYDKYNRVRKKEFVGESTTIYTYNSDGLLADATTKNAENTLVHAKAFTYDNLLRPYTEKETVIDGKWLQKTYAYANGAVNAVTYSSNNGNIVTQNYLYANGYNTELKLDNSVSVWKLTAENDMGLATATTTGKLTRTYEYNAAGILTRRTIKNGSTFLQNMSYGFDTATGNLSWRRDNTRNITENFGYDNLNRLTDFGGKKMMSYDNKGNITDFAGIGKIEYTESLKPYRATLVTPYGTQIPDRYQEIDYNAQMRPSLIKEKSNTLPLTYDYTAAFTYSGEGDRIKMQLKNGTTDQLLRYYVSAEYETESGVSGTKERLYLGGDAYSATAVYLKEGTGTWNVYYIGRDHLGSVTHVIDANGVVKEELSYDPWGRLRNPVNQALYAADAQASLLLGGRGYTGHEHLAMFGLINMNARLYDPVLGRFLSPDPYVQAPNWSQNFNRYSYAMNNPLRYNDPSGEIIPIIAAAVIGVYINFSMQTLSGNINNFGDALKAMAVGAAAGAVGSATGGLITGVGFVAGATSGAISGFSSGMILGAGNAWSRGADFGQGLGAGLKGGLIGAGTGALLVVICFQNCILVH